MLLVLFGACNDDEEDTTPEITITQSAFTLNEPDTIGIPFTITPADYDVNPENLEIMLEEYHSSSSSSSLSGNLLIPRFDIIAVTAGNENGNYVAEVKIDFTLEPGDRFHVEAAIGLRLDKAYESNWATLTINAQKEEEVSAAQQEDIP